MITPTSTPPSTAASECSAPRSSVSSKYHKPSLLGDPKKALNYKKPGLLGEYPAAQAVNALRGLLPLPMPQKPGSNPSVPNLGNNKNSCQNGLIKNKTRKQPRKTKERRDSTTESDEPSGKYLSILLHEFT